MSDNENLAEQLRAMDAYDSPAEAGLLMADAADEIERMKKMLRKAGINPYACEDCLGKGGKLPNGVEYCNCGDPPGQLSGDDNGR